MTSCCAGRTATWPCGPAPPPAGSPRRRPRSPASAGKDHVRRPGRPERRRPQRPRGASTPRRAPWCCSSGGRTAASGTSRGGPPGPAMTRSRPPATSTATDTPTWWPATRPAPSGSWPATAARGFAARVQVPGGFASYDVISGGGDLSHDGRAGPLRAEHTTGQAYILPGSGDGTFGPPAGSVPRLRVRDRPGARQRRGQRGSRRAGARPAARGPGLGQPRHLRPRPPDRHRRGLPAPTRSWPSATGTATATAT